MEVHDEHPEQREATKDVERGDSSGRTEGSFHGREAADDSTRDANPPVTGPATEGNQAS